MSARGIILRVLTYLWDVCNLFYTAFPYTRN